MDTRDEPSMKIIDSLFLRHVGKYKIGIFSKYECQIWITLTCKKITGMKFCCSVGFSPAEYEYESQFFPSRSGFTKFYDKSQKFNKIGCL